MVIISFYFKTSYKSLILWKNFLLININIKIVLNIIFFNFSNINIYFKIKSLNKNII